MKRAIARKWIAALRSGRFKQTTNTLRKKDGNSYSYCCLGVLSAISPHRRNCGLAYEAYLSEEVKKWSGLTRQTRLSNMNDNEGWDFTKIADYIAKHWRDL